MGHRPARVHLDVDPTAPPHRPRLVPGVRVLTRGDGAVQIGGEDGLILEAANSSIEAFVRAIGGTLTADELISSRLIAPDEARRILEALHGRGLVEDTAVDVAPLRTLSVVGRDRMRGATRTLGAPTHSTVEAMHVIARRRSAWVEVRGTHPVGSAVGLLLADGGVGHVTFAGVHTLQADDIGPMGPGPDHVGQLSRRAARAALRERYGADTATKPIVGRYPDVVVLTPAEGVDDPVHRDVLMRAAVPHLRATVGATAGFLGPFVLPGTSTCLRCVDLLHAQQDRAWPHLAAQLAERPDGRPRSIPPSQGALTTLVASLAALQVLTHLDQQDVPSTCEQVWQINAADGAVTQHHVRPHHACGCQWAA